MTKVLDLSTLVVASFLSLTMWHLFSTAFVRRGPVTFGGVVAWSLFLFPFLALADLIVRFAW